MSTPAVHIDGLTHRYGTHLALQDVSLTIPDGCCFGVLGPNGSGKTTLFRILSTLMPPTQGSASIFGHDTTSQSHVVRTRIGMVFQEPALDEKLTVRENLRVQGALYGLRGTEVRDRIKSMLDRFDLSDRAGDRVDTLSGGLRRRADLARGLLHQPDLLLLDEPTTGLDPKARRTFWQGLDRLRRANGTTLVIATHLMDEAERCDEVAILDRGHLVVNGAPETLKSELGGEMLWLESADAPALRDRIEAQFGVDVQLIGRALQISPPDAPSLLSSLYEAFGDRIDSATVRAPTLDDVFVAHTGYRPDEEELQIVN